MTFLVDTSVWSLALRRTPAHRSPHQDEVVSRLEELVHEGRVAMLGPIRQELLSGIRRSAQFELLRDQLRAFPDQPLQTVDHETAAELTNKCLGSGISGSGVDMLMCAVALRRGWTIFTTDSDFDRYASATGVRVLLA